MKRSFCFYLKLLFPVIIFLAIIGSTPARADVRVNVGLGVGGCPPPPYYYNHGPRPWYYRHRPYCDYPYPAPTVVYYTPAPSYVYVEQPAPTIVTATTSTSSSSTSSVANGTTTVTTTTTSTPYGVRLSPSKVRSPYTNFTIDTHSPSGTVIYDANTGQPFLVP